MSSTSQEIIEGTSGQNDLFQYLAPTNFDLPHVIEDLEQVRQEIEKVLANQEIDRTKMLTVFQVQAIAKEFVQKHTPVGFKYNDFFIAGLLTGLIVNSQKQ